MPFESLFTYSYEKDWYKMTVNIKVVVPFDDFSWKSGYNFKCWLVVIQRVIIVFSMISFVVHAHVHASTIYSMYIVFLTTKKCMLLLKINSVKNFLRSMCGDMWLRMLLLWSDELLVTSFSFYCTFYSLCLYNLLLYCECCLCT